MYVERLDTLILTDTLQQALDSAGQKEFAQSVYEEGAASGAVKPWKTSKDSVGRPIRVLDLHMFSGSLARAAVRSYLENLLCGKRAVTDDVVIVVGKGLRSRNDPVLRTAVTKMLLEDYGIRATDVETNAGRLKITKDDLQMLVAKRRWSS